MLQRGDGVELFWEERGSGALVVIVPHWYGLPEIFDPLTESIGDDRRVVRYDARGTGRSTRTGPHDLDTAAADLEAVVEAAGGSAVLFGIMDACNSAVRAAAARPEQITAVVGIAAFPAARRELEGTNSMIASKTVVETFLEMFEADYRGAMRSLVTAGNPQLSEDELRTRVQRQIEYCPHEVGVARFHAYLHDDPNPYARALGPRLNLVYSPNITRPWFPPLEETLAAVGRFVPEASVEVVEDGIVSRPDLTAAIIRRTGAASPARSG